MSACARVARVGRVKPSASGCDDSGASDLANAPMSVVVRLNGEAVPRALFRSSGQGVPRVKSAKSVDQYVCQRGLASMCLWRGGD